MTICGKTRLYGIIGKPVSHSLSPAMHNAAFAALGEDRVYLPFPAEYAGDAVKGVRGLGIEGASVTIPHKEAVISFLDEIDPVAARIGAVNTIQVIDDGKKRKLRGVNTDWIGANRALEQELSLKDRKVALLGAGGAARAIGFGLLEAGAVLSLFSRTESRGRPLADILGCSWCSLAETGSLDGDILINATSVGMVPNTNASPVGREVLSRFTVVMDIVYSPLATRLLKEGKREGCTCINGLEMLLYQGVAQFELWTGLKAPVEVMREALFAAAETTLIQGKKT
ncbi:MAG: shikimate dehydrogenase [Proteobacteria bacterium]|nr:MAG: shikimate dehydrogenase [Pseudomonadota bacterium]